MKINLLIRTFVISNLYLSLFDVPNKLSSEFVELYIHNDNPEAKQEFIKIIEEFKKLYPDYAIHTVQEDENKQMFMSQFEMILYYNEDNKWTMLLDDDDQLYEDFQSLVPLIFDNPSNVCLKYKCKIVSKQVTANGWYQWHRIYPTNVLKLFYTYKDQVIAYLIRSIDSTKLSYWEDEIFCRLCGLFTGVMTKLFHHNAIVFNRYDHNAGYPLGYPKTTWMMPKVMLLRHNLLNNLLNIQYEKIL